jgi:hypothetical protein
LSIRTKESGNQYQLLCFSEILKWRILDGHLPPRGRPISGRNIKGQNGRGSEESEHENCQTQNTPFTQDPLASEVGWLGVGQITQDILEGSYTPSDHITYFTLDFISELKQNDAAKQDNPYYNITPKLWMNYWL